MSLKIYIMKSSFLAMTHSPSKMKESTRTLSKCPLCGIISRFKAKNKKNTKERKIKGIISTLAETKKEEFC